MQLHLPNDGQESPGQQSKHKHIYRMTGMTARNFEDKTAWNVLTEYKRHVSIMFKLRFVL